MARHDGTSHGYADFPDDGELDSNWADAPTEPADADEEVDDLDERYLRTLTTPSYDLGPTTESFTIDVTPPLPDGQATPLDAPLADPPAPLADAPGPLDAPAPLADSDAYPRHAAPGSAAPGPEPAAQPEPAPAAAPAPTTAPPDPVELRRPIPPLPDVAGALGAESLTAATVLRQSRPRPQSGWRKSIFAATGGRINFGPSAADVHRSELILRARTPVTGCHRVAVISLKGGVGKTTTTAALGAMFADLRGDRVIAVDANPDRGTLGERVPRESGATVRHLLAEKDTLHRYADVRAFTSQSPTRLEVLASDSDPHVSAAFSEQDYRDTVATLERFYNLVLTDCGTGLLHDAMRGILGLASSLVVVSSASLDGARSASATLDWLEAHGFDQLARTAVVVISSVRQGGGLVDVPQLEEHFAARCRAVVTIPYDPHLEAGGVLDLEDLNIETSDAYRELAAVVGEAFDPRKAHKVVRAARSGRKGKVSRGR